DGLVVGELLKKSYLSAGGNNCHAISGGHFVFHEPRQERSRAREAVTGQMHVVNEKKYCPSASSLARAGSRRSRNSRLRIPRGNQLPLFVGGAGCDLIKEK